MGIPKDKSSGSPDRSAFRAGFLGFNHLVIGAPMFVLSILQVVTFLGFVRGLDDLLSVLFPLIPTLVGALLVALGVRASHSILRRGGVVAPRAVMQSAIGFSVAPLAGISIISGPIILGLFWLWDGQLSDARQAGRIASDDSAIAFALVAVFLQATFALLTAIFANGLIGGFIWRGRARTIAARTAPGTAPRTKPQNPDIPAPTPPAAAVSPES